MSLVERLEKKGLIHPPKWLACNTQYVTIMGSHAYGVADTSVKNKLPDFDIYGWAIEPIDMIFPALKGEIPGFGRQQQRFGQFQQHHIMEENAPGGNNVAKEWDLNIYGIIKYFELCRGNNPNMIDSMWTPENCVLHCTQVGRMVRDNRRLFIGKIAWKRFRGYAWGQMKKMNTKNPEGDRKEIVDRFGYDVKYAYHLIRLMDEVDQIFDGCDRDGFHGDIDLQRSKEVMKAVRRGEWTQKDVEDWFMEKEKEMDPKYTACKMKDFPDEEKLRKLLMACLEEHYGSLDRAVREPDWSIAKLQEIDELLDNIRPRMYGAKAQKVGWIKRWIPWIK
jgi:predicted nucleotidyltransferase